MLFQKLSEFNTALFDVNILLFSILILSFKRITFCIDMGFNIAKDVILQFVILFIYL